MRKKIYFVLKLLLCFILFFCIGDISNYVLKIFGINIDDLSNKALVIYQFVMSSIMFISLFIVYNKSI